MPPTSSRGQRSPVRASGRDSAAGSDIAATASAQHAPPPAVRTAGDGVDDDDDDALPGLTPEIETKIQAILKRPARRGALARALGFRFDADIVPVMIVFATFLADLYVMLTQSWQRNLAWFFIMLVPKAGMSAWNHHHAHLSTFDNVYLNRLLEIPYLWITGVGSGMWQLHHVVGHHRHYLEQPLDESAWRAKSGRTMGSIEYGLEVWGTAHWRAFNVGLQHRGMMRILLKSLPLAAAATVLAIYYRGLSAVITWLLAPAVSLYITAWHTYFHHSGLPDTKSHFEASYNIEDPIYNLLTLNLGYHTAHHYRGSIHWSLLPEVHAVIRPLIPSNLYRLPPVPLRFVAQPLKHEGGAAPVHRVLQFPADSWHRWAHIDDYVTVPSWLRSVPGAARLSKAPPASRQKKQ